MLCSINLEGVRGSTESVLDRKALLLLALLLNIFFRASLFLSTKLYADTTTNYLPD